VDQPAYVGEPVWITATSGHLENVRYPFHAAMEDTGCNEIEVKRDGVLLPRLPIRPIGTLDGLVCGSAAPPGSPPHRLPLHALFALDKPGKYSVHWAVLGPKETAHGMELSSNEDSGWATFELRQPTREERERWLATLLANPPQDPGLLAGDFLPSLLAAVPDPRVLRIYMHYMHDKDGIVSGMAAAGLRHFTDAEVRSTFVDSIVQSGPSDQLAYFATYHSRWTQSDESRVVHATTAYLQAPSSPSQTAAALTLLYFIFDVPNHAWPADPDLKAYADNEVLTIAPGVLRSGTAQVVHELALYLGSMSSPRAHELLLQIAERSDDAAEQARTCLTWHPELSDLPHLAAFLMTPGDADPYGRDRSSLPYSLVRGYGEAALPYLEKAVTSSPYQWVRTQSAQELALHNRPAGFKFLLASIQENQPYKAKMLQWVSSQFRQSLPADASEQDVIAFLVERSH
jgi:hypothetical protein